jgi:hypothetical protein
VTEHMLETVGEMMGFATTFARRPETNAPEG